MDGYGRLGRRAKSIFIIVFAVGLALAAVWGTAHWRAWGTRNSWLDLALDPLPVLGIDRVVVLKGRRELLLYDDGVVVKRYPVGLGFAPAGHKAREGDGRTPEGRYTLDWRRVSEALGPAIHVSYPNREDRAQAAEAGVDPGGGIMLHALRDSLPWEAAAATERRWTRGCIGLRRRDMRELWHAVADGTPIDIRP